MKTLGIEVLDPNDEKGTGVVLSVEAILSLGDLASEPSSAAGSRGIRLEDEAGPETEAERQELERIRREYEGQPLEHPYEVDEIPRDPMPGTPAPLPPDR